MSFVLLKAVYLATYLFLTSRSAVAVIPVRDEADLKTALVSGARIELQNDILLTKPVRIVNINDVVIYGKGFKLDGQYDGQYGGVSCVVINGTEGRSATLITLDGLVISRGYSSQNEQGGGLTVRMAVAHIVNCSIQSNYAKFNGGGIHVGNGGEVTITSSSIINNTARYWGGGIRVHRGSLKLLHSRVHNNLATGGGGGLHFVEAHTSEVRGCIISNNNAFYYGGGGIGIYDSHAGVNIEGFPIIV